MHTNLLKKTVVKAAIAVALTYGAAQLLPGVSGMPLYAIAAMMPVMLLVAMIFLRALKRHEDLAGAISMELNKLRRVYHLGKNLAGDDPKLRQWFTDLHGFLYGYLNGFEKRDFKSYQESNGDFRKLSYHLYTLPELSSEKDRVLYRELLEAAGEIAGSRQRIQELWNGGLSDQLWSAIDVMASLAALALIVSVGRQDWLTGGLLLAVMVSALTIVRHVDQMRILSGTALSKRYVENLARLELKRH